jgi:hypothetical protein
MGGKALELYESEVRKLPLEERLLLIELINRGIEHDTAEPQEKRSILELRGLGAEIWQGVEAQTYVNELRDEWDHSG